MPSWRRPDDGKAEDREFEASGAAHTAPGPKGPDDGRTPEARARISQAVKNAARLFPPLETETWPASRPLTEWLLSLLPEGGTGYIRPEWSKAALRTLTNRFFVSPFGRGLDDQDHRELLGEFLRFGTDSGPGDPLRWSPVAVEILLEDWIPRTIAGDASFLGKAPALLREFIRFCHGERGIAATTGSAPGRAT